MLNKMTVTLGLGPRGIGIKTMMRLLAELAKNHGSQFADRGGIIDYHTTKRTEFGPQLKRHRNPDQIPSDLILAATKFWMMELQASSGAEHFFLAGFPVSVQEASLWKFTTPQVRVIALVPDGRHEIPELEPFNGHVLRLPRSMPIRSRLSTAINHINARQELTYRWQTHLNDHRHPVRKAIKELGN